MGLPLPGELIEALSWLGMTWPEADEELLLQRGQHWLELGRAGGDQSDLANDAVPAHRRRSDPGDRHLRTETGRHGRVQSPHAKRRRAGL